MTRRTHMQWLVVLLATALPAVLLFSGCVTAEPARPLPPDPRQVLISSGALSGRSDLTFSNIPPVARITRGGDCCPAQPDGHPCPGLPSTVFGEIALEAWREGQQIVMRWTSMPNRIYEVQFTTALGRTWITDQRQPTHGEGYNYQYARIQIHPCDSRFYRVRWGYP
jgi:hypothetical protein